MEKSHDGVLRWLLEADPENPGVRYFALRELLDRPADDPEVVAAQEAVMATGPAPAILAAQDPDGYWVEPGIGYGPKYRGTVWQVIFLAQFGADGRDARVRAGCEYVLEHARAKCGGFSLDGKASGMVPCMQGNMAAALADLGWRGDERFEAGLDWLARSVTGERIAPARNAPSDPRGFPPLIPPSTGGLRGGNLRYYRSGNSGPGFLCAANNHLPCAWGAVKAMLALSKVPKAERTPTVSGAIEQGVQFLLGHNVAAADYPTGYSTKPSGSWFKFGYPIGYVSDVLQNLEALTALGYGADPRMKPAIDLLLSKRDAEGRWRLEYTYNGKTWADVEQKGQPSKWVTLRALRVLRRAGG
ncbi:MAG: nitrogen fixation protein NifH [Chloroflexi bacterium]|nr:nitrogen fixation protein NifH [Chloroflexota bacterium]